MLDEQGADDRATHDPRRGASGQGRHGEQGHGGKLQACRAALQAGVGDVVIADGRKTRLGTLADSSTRLTGCTQGGAMKTTLDSIQARESQYVLHTYRRQPVAFVRGKGPRLYDVDGREYLDFVSGIGVASLGHAHPGLAAAIADQARTLLHTSNLYYHPFQAEAAARLSTLSGLSRAFFCNSGAEANEACLKFARRYWHTQGVNDRTAFVAIEHAFAGRTMGALSVTYDEHYRTPFQPLLGPVTFVDRILPTRSTPRSTTRRPPSSLNRFEEKAACASAPRVLRCDRRCLPSHWNAAHRRRSADGARSNRDILSTSRRSVGSRIWSRWARRWARVSRSAPPSSRSASPQDDLAGDHGSTYGGNLLATRAAAFFLEELMERGLLDHVRSVGDHLERLPADARLKHPVIAEVRGAG